MKHETHEIFALIDNTGSWFNLIEQQERGADIEEVAQLLEQTIRVEKSGPEGIYDYFDRYPDAHWDEVEWEELAEHFLRETIGEDWRMTVEFDLLDSLRAENRDSLAQQLRAIAEMVQNGEYCGTVWSITIL